MKAKVPDFVLKNNAKEDDWIEEHDFIRVVGGSPYDKKNQEDWWLLNYKIRNLFEAMEREINDLIKIDKKPSIRDISWTNIAKRLKCDRATLQHRKRKAWVINRKERLENLIRSNSQEITPKVKIDEIQDLKAKLEKSRNTVAEWYKKCNELTAKNKDLLRLLEKKDEKINELQKIIEQLLDQNPSNAQFIAKTRHLYRLTSNNDIL